MRIFNFNNCEADYSISIVCNSASTRNGFKHVATLCLNGHECETAKICYLNRTWERFTYQSVLQHLVEKSKRLSKDQKNDLMSQIEKFN